MGFRQRIQVGCAGCTKMDMTTMADDDSGRKKRLGRGLAALIGEVGNEPPADPRPPRDARKVPIEFLTANPRNPRKSFSELAIDELTESVRARGIVQPLLV